MPDIKDNLLYPKNRPNVSAHTGKAYDCGEAFNVLQMANKDNKLGYYTYEVEDDIFHNTKELFFNPDKEGDIKTVGSILMLGGIFHSV